MMNAMAAIRHSQLCILRNAGKIVNTDAALVDIFWEMLNAEC
jgi:hypothetical protein